MPKMRELTLAERSQIFYRRINGDSLKKIALDSNISAEGVRKIVHRLEQNGTAENQPKSGHPRKTTRKQDRVIVREVKKNPLVSTKQLKSDLNLPIEEIQIHARIKQVGFLERISKKQPFISKINAKKRFAFAKQFKNKSPDFWKKVIFIDESKFELRCCNRRKYVWKKQGECFKSTVITPTVKYGGESVCVWGCFSANDVGNLHFIDGILTGARYVNIVQQNLQDSTIKMNIHGDYISQQDNDPKHKCKLATKYFNGYDFQLLPWPPQSPYLNLIEHLWDHLDRSVSEKFRNNKSVFKQALLSIWNSIDENIINKLFESMPRRLEEVIRNKGYQTSY
ncbi:Transposable element Tc1 transposase [Anthophora plagiata]